MIVISIIIEKSKTPQLAPHKPAQIFLVDRLHIAYRVHMPVKLAIEVYIYNERLAKWLRKHLESTVLIIATYWGKKNTEFLRQVLQRRTFVDRNIRPRLV